MFVEATSDSLDTIEEKVPSCLHGMGLLMGTSRIVRGIFDPLLEFYRPLPPLAYLFDLIMRRLEHKLVPWKAHR